MAESTDARLAALAGPGRPVRRDQFRAVRDLMRHQLHDGCHTYGPCGCGRMTSRGCGWCPLCLAEMLARLQRDAKPQEADDGE